MSIMQMLLAKAEPIDPSFNLKYADFVGWPKNTFIPDPDEVNNPLHFTWKPDGTRFFLVNKTGNFISQYDLSEAWDVNTATFAGSVNVYNITSSAPDRCNAPLSCQFRTDTSNTSNDGSKLYVYSDTYRRIFEFNLSTNWDVTTATWYQTGTTQTEAVFYLENFQFSADGTKLFMVDDNTDTIYQYTLTTAWNIAGSNVTYANKSLGKNPSAVGTGTIFFRKDGGTRDGKDMWWLDPNYKRVYHYTLSTAYDISTAQLQSSYGSTGLELANAFDLVFSDDGKKLIIFDSTDDLLRQYNLTTAWDVATLEDWVSPYSEKNRNGEQSQKGMYWKNDGTECYILDVYTTNKVVRWIATVPWDASSLYSPSSISSDYLIKDISAQTSYGEDLFFSNDGYYMFVLARRDVYRYDLNTAWDISTANYATGQNIYVNAQDASMTGIHFREDSTGNGKVMYLCGRQADKIYQYSSNTPWDLTSFSYDNKSFSTRTEQYTPEDVSLSENGDLLHVIDRNGIILQAKLSIPWDISTATKELYYHGAKNVEGDIHSLYMKKDGSDLFVLHSLSHVHRHRISLTPYAHPNISTSTAKSSRQYPWYGFATVGGFSFEPDGSHIYVASGMSATTNTIKQYSLVRPWDHNGGYATDYTYTFPIQSGESYHTIKDIFFKPDGKTLYYCEDVSERIVAQTLSTAWDLSTISSSYTYYGHGTGGAGYKSPMGLHFSPDGKYMFTLGEGRRVRRFELSTPWDITTATHNSASGELGANKDHPKGIHFKYDGTVLYAIDKGARTIYQWNLNTPWDVSNVTATNYTDSLYVNSSDTQPEFMFINDSGTHLYFNGNQNHKLYHRTL